MLLTYWQILPNKNNNFTLAQTGHLTKKPHTVLAVLLTLLPNVQTHIISCVACQTNKLYKSQFQTKSNLENRFRISAYLSYLWSNVH